MIYSYVIFIGETNDNTRKLLFLDASKKKTLPVDIRKEVRKRKKIKNEEPIELSALFIKDVIIQD